MPNELRIVVQGPFKRTHSGAVVGEIYFEIAGWAFPEKRWFDFVPTVLEWWLDALARDSGLETLRFMDGPFEVRVITVADGEYRLEFISRTASGEEIQRTLNVTWKALVTAVTNAAAAARAALVMEGLRAEANELELRRAKLLRESPIS